MVPGYPKLGIWAEYPVIDSRNGLNSVLGVTGGFVLRSSVLVYKPTWVWKGCKFGFSQIWTWVVSSLFSSMEAKNFEAKTSIWR